MILDLRQHRKAIIAILIVIVGGCLLLLAGKKFSSDITDMLPKNSVAAGMLKALSEENIAGRITVELRLNDDCDNLELLPKAVKQLESSLKSPEIISVFTGFPMPDAETLANAYTALPLLTDDTELAEVARLSGTNEIDKSMRRNFIRLAAPGGLEMCRFIEKDPLGFNRIVLKKLELFSKIVSYRTAPGSSMLIGPDRRRALVILETAIPVSDGNRAEKFLSSLNDVLKKLPPQISSQVLCGHKHTLGNAKIIAGDIVAVSIASLIIFALIFVLIYRRSPQSFLIILMPLVAVLLAVTIMALALNQVSAFVIGLGGVMAGISVDYGIHVYAMYGQNGGNIHALRKIIRPLAAGALTTMAIFVAFLFSGVNTYIQLAIFAMLSIVFSLALALYVLPNLLPANVKNSIVNLKTPLFKTRGALVIVLTWCVIIAVAGVLTSLFFAFDRGVTSLDGAGDDVINAEKDFNAYWSKQEMPAILSVKEDNREAALEAGERLAAYAGENRIAGFVSPVMLTPSTKTIQRNLNAWRKFWTENKIKATTAQITSAGKKNGFSDDAFVVFNSWLAKSCDGSESQSQLLVAIQEKLLKRTGDKWTLTSFMSDTQENYAIIEKVQKQIPELRVISPRLLRYSIGAEVLDRLLWIGGASLLIVLLLSIFATGGVITGIVSLLPVAAAITVICGLSAAFKLPLTIPSCVAMIIITGLSIDYGIFMVFRCFKALPDDVMTAVTLSAMTTAAGASTLLFAAHPVMFKLGITLFAGIIVSYATAVTLIPALAVLLRGKRLNLVKLSGFLLILMFGAGCSWFNNLPEPGPLLSVPAPQKYNPPDKR
ncbi:MAG: MMPL family transporter, partial [Victivallaceae bacterium]